MTLQRKIISILIILIAFFFIGRALYYNWCKIPFEELRFNIGFLAISFFLFSCFYFISAFGWTSTLKTLGVQLSLKRAIQITSVSRFGRYVPGKFWGFLGQAYFAKQDNIPVHKTILSIILLTILTILSALIIFLCSLIFFVGKGLPDLIYFTLILIPLCFIALHPKIFAKIVNWGLKIMKRESIDFNFHYLHLLRLLGIYSLSWLFQGTSFYFLIRSFYQITPQIWFPLIGAYSIAWIMGFLAVIVPGGLGVREGILSFLLKFFLPTSIGIMSAILWRIWAIIGMFIFFVIFAGGLRKPKYNESMEIKNKPVRKSF